MKLMIAKRASKTDPSKILNEVLAVESIEEKYNGPDEDTPF